MYMSNVPQAKTVHGRTRLAAILADLLCYRNQNMFYFGCVNASSMTIIDKFYINRKLVFSSFM